MRDFRKLRLLTAFIVSFLIVAKALASTVPTTFFSAAGTGPDPDAWNIIYGVYSGTSVNSTPTTNMRGVYVSSNGLYVYTTAYPTGTVYQAKLTTAWNLATYTAYKSQVLTSTGNLADVTMSPDGTKMYASYLTGNTIEYYTLSTPYDVTSGTKIYTLGVTSPYGVDIDPSGTHLYVFNTTNVRQYTLSTAWDLSTATLTHTASGLSHSYSGGGIKPDGTSIYLDGNGTPIYQYNLATPYDITTAGTAITFSVGSQISGSTGGMHFRNDNGLSFYVGSYSTGKIYQYNIP